MIDFAALFRVLQQHGVRFVLVGGAAATAHGAARLTQDLDIVYDRDDSNLRHLVNALAPHEPYLRGAPRGLPFQWEAETLRRGLNFTLTTRLGDLDLLGEITGGGRYGDLISHTIELELFDTRCACITLDKLIEVKRAAGRPKDLEAIAELETIRDERAGE